MAIDSFVQPMLKLEIFQGLRPLQITEIARRAYRVIYKPGDFIMREDEEGDAAIVIVSGEAVRIAGPGLSDAAESIPAGSLLGEMAMLVETRHSSTIIARTSVRALRISREELQAQMAEDATVAEHFLARISSRLSFVLETLKAIDTGMADSSVAVPARGASAALHPTHVH